MERNKTNSRRTFLKNAAKGAMVAAVAPSVLSGEIRMPEVIPQESQRR